MLSLWVAGMGLGKGGEGGGDIGQTGYMPNPCLRWVMPLCLPEQSYAGCEWTPFIHLCDATQIVQVFLIFVCTIAGVTGFIN